MPNSIIITITFMIAALNMVSAQVFDELDEFDDPVPFSLRSGIREQIKPELMEASYELKAYNNDSLLEVLNPPGTKRLHVSIVADSTAYNFKKVANYYDLGHGDLWLYRITGSTTKMISITFHKFDIPQGAMFSWYQLNNSSPFDEGTDVNYYENWKHFRNAAGTNGNELYVEYYEPKDVENEAEIIFDKIFYSASDGIGISLNDILKKKVDSECANLKSGSWGTSSYDCNNKLPCSSVSAWEDIAKAVVYIQIKLSNGDISQGTGFLINKSNGYSSSDRPYIVTCGHLFEDGVNGNYQWLYCYVNYVDHSCDDIWPRSGKNIGDFDIEEFGSSSNIDPDSFGYYASDDYALLQVNDKDIEDLAKYNLQYAGWTANHNYANNGYVYIGHPKGDVKTVNKWNSYAPVNRTEKFFAVYNDLGVGEEGFSGSPVFSTISNLVVGWVCTKESDEYGPFTCGDGDQFTHCGLFDELHSTISSYVDPSNSGSASNSNPTTSVLPSHCSNCVKDEDETDIDCGGSCQPCGMADDLTVSSNADIYGKININARFSLTVDGSDEQVEFKSQSYTLTAGESIELRNTNISDVSSFTATVNSEQKYADAQGCQDPCIFVANVFTPNGDGVNDFLIARFAFVNSYSIQIFNSNQILVYSSFNNSVYENGILALWDGEGSVSGAVYYIYLNTTDCNGNTSGWTYEGFAHCYKSAYIDYDLGETVSDEELFLVYPNPASQELKISICDSYLCDQDKYLISIYDSSGRKIKSKEASGAYNIFS